MASTGAHLKSYPFHFSQAISGRVSSFKASASSFVEDRRAQSRKEERAGTMIYRKWSLLTGPAAILGGIVATTVVANFIFVQNDPFSTSDQKKLDTVSSLK